MNFRIRILRRARRAYNQILAYIAERSPSGATAWGNAFDAALERLEESADTFAVAWESEGTGLVVREVLFNTRRGLTYRILFTIAGVEVLVLHVRGPGQAPLTPDELRPY